MKYVILHGEGLADGPYPELDGNTPLQAAATPNLDEIGGAGELGLAAVPGEGTPQFAGVTALGLLGYDPRKFGAGPAPFEASGLGVALGEQDVAFRCSMVTLKPPAGPGLPKGGPQFPEIRKLGPHLLMDDDTGGDITTEEARELIDAVNEQLGSEDIQFYPGTGHRHFLVWVGGKAKAACVDPAGVVGQAIGESLPKGDGADILKKLMEASLIILGSHGVNEQRVEAGLKPANCLWLWGQGKAPNLPKLPDRFHVEGTVLSMSDMVRGIGVCAGLETVDPEEVAQNGKVDLSMQAKRAMQALEKRDFLYLHVDVLGSAVERADPKARCQALEDFDRGLVGVIMEGLRSRGDFRLLLVGEQDGHGAQPAGGASPTLYALIQSPGRAQGKKARRFGDAGAESAKTGVRDATKLVARLFAKN